MSIPGVPLYRGSGLSQAISYASNIQAGANTVKVALNGATPFVDVRITEYHGMASNSAFVAGSSVQGSGSLAATPNISAEAGNLLFAAGMTVNAFTGASSGYTKRVITSPDSDIVEDRVVANAGSYNATASNNNGAYVLQVAAFRVPAPAPARAPAPAPNPMVCSVTGGTSSSPHIWYVFPYSVYAV